MGLLLRLVLIVITLNAVLFVIGMSDPTFTMGGEDMMSGIVNVNGTGGVALAGNTPFSDLGSQLNSSEVNMGVLDYSISVWGLVKSALGFLYKFFFAPTNMLVAAQAPAPLIIVITAVWLVVYILAILGVVWRWEI